MKCFAKSHGKKYLLAAMTAGLTLSLCACSGGMLPGSADGDKGAENSGQVGEGGDNGAGAGTGGTEEGSSIHSGTGGTEEGSSTHSGSGSVAGGTALPTPPSQEYLQQAGFGFSPQMPLSVPAAQRMVFII